MKTLVGENLSISDLQIGKWVYLVDEAASHIDLLMNTMAIDKLNEVVGGCYYITDIDKSFVNPPNATEQGKVVAQIYLMHEDWNPEDKSVLPVHLALNEDADIILAGAFLLEKALFNIVHSVKELIEANKSRFNCFNCKNPLNIVTINLRICNVCETKFANFNGPVKAI
jgi:hypothetical protein